MAGIILTEGPSKGTQPMLEVLSIGSTTSTRQSSDLLPYMPELRKFFSPLPQTAAQMSLKTVKVPLTDLEAVTKTLIKVKQPMEELRIRKGKHSSQN